MVSEPTHMFVDRSMAGHMTDPLQSIIDAMNKKNTAVAQAGLIEAFAPLPGMSHAVVVKQQAKVEKKEPKLAAEKPAEIKPAPQQVAQAQIPPMPLPKTYHQTAGAIIHTEEIHLPVEPGVVPPAQNLQEHLVRMIPAFTAESFQEVLNQRDDREEVIIDHSNLSQQYAQLAPAAGESEVPAPTAIAAPVATPVPVAAPAPVAPPAAVAAPEPVAAQPVAAPANDEPLIALPAMDSNPPAIKAPVVAPAPAIVPPAPPPSTAPVAAPAAPVVAPLPPVAAPVVAEAPKAQPVVLTKPAPAPAKSKNKNKKDKKQKSARPPQPSQQVGESPFTAGDRANGAQEISPESRQILGAIPSGIDRKPDGRTQRVSIDRIAPPAQTPMEDPQQITAKREAMGINIEVKKPRLDVNYELRKAYDAQLAGHSSEAIATYREILDSDANNTQAMLGLATSYHRTGQLAMARPLYGRVLSIDGTNRTALNNFLVLLSDEAPEEALSQLQSLSARNPDFAAVPAQMAVVYQKLKQPEKAIESMAHAMQLAPANLSYRYNLAVLLDRQHNYAQAATLYGQLLEANARGEAIPGNIQQIQQRLTFIRSNKP